MHEITFFFSSASFFTCPVDFTVNSASELHQWLAGSYLWNALKYKFVTIQLMPVTTSYVYSVAHFWITLGQSVLETLGYQTCRIQTPWLWTKQEKLKFTSLTISPETAAVKWLLIMNLLLVQLKSLQRKSIMRVDHALYMHGRLLRMHWSARLSFALNRGLNFCLEIVTVLSAAP